MRVLKYDGVIVGGGGAGLMASINAYDNGAKVALVMKSLFGKAHTVMAEGGIAAAISKDDSPILHFVDTIIGGYGLNDYKKVWKMVNEAKEILEFLESKGAIFDRDEKGNILPRAFGGHSRKRTFHIGDRTGLSIMRVLQDEVLKRDIDIFEKTFVFKILVKNNRVVGCVAIDFINGEVLLFNVKFIILATGGCGNIYKYTTNSRDVCGDGVWLAYDAGAEIMDMEFIQFHPTCMVEPEEKRGVLITEAVRGEGGILVNRFGERFMKSAKDEKGRPKYPGIPELSTRDKVSLAIEEEYEKGNGPVYLVCCRDAWKNIVKEWKIPEKFKELVDENQLPSKERVKEKLFSMYEQMLKFSNLDITKQPVPVRPAQHYMMGGVKVNENCETNIKGLYACGEVSAGTHGANRLGSNSLLDILVEGKTAGVNAAKYSKKVKLIPIKNANVDFIFGKSKVDYLKIREKMQEVMWKYVSLKRDEKGLRKALNEIEKLSKLASKIKINKNFKGDFSSMEALETIGMLKVAKLIIKGALLRKESRGAHFRVDYPKMDKKYLVHFVFKRDKVRIEKVEKIPKKLLKYFPEKWIEEIY